MTRAGLGLARHGTAWQGLARHGLFIENPSGRGWAGRGMGFILRQHTLHSVLPERNFVLHT